MNISYDLYRIFYHAARCGSFTQAARALGNNQPNITRAIRTLEYELDCTLFVRSNKGAALTPEGEKLYQHVAVAVQQIEAGEAELLLDRTLQKGVVSVAVSEVALHGLLLPVLEHYHISYPGVRIRISNCSTPQAISELKSGLADLALVTTPAGIGEDMRSVRLREFSSVAVCGTAYAHLKGRQLSLRELSQCPMVSLGAKTRSYELYAKWFSDHGLVFSPDIEAATTDQLLPMIRHNLGVGFVPEMFVEGADIIRLQLTEPIPKGSICLVQRKGHSLSMAAMRLSDMLSQAQETGDLPR